MSLPPSFPPSRFDRLREADSDQVCRSFDTDFRALREFLNSKSSIRNLQQERGAWTNPRSDEAFLKWKCEPQHWYTFNLGGRNEAQFNLGMWSEYLRVGLGFEFTKKEHGDPPAVQAAFTRLHHAINKDKEDFERLVVSVPLELEIFPGRSGALQTVGSDRALESITHLRRSPNWVFLGRFLRPTTDEEILADPIALGNEIDRVFGLMRPWWKKANGA